MLEDQPSCPRVSVQRLTAGEINAIKSMYLDKKHLHYSTTALAMMARVIKGVFASASTWSRVIKQHKVSRVSKRIYLCRPKTGIRASSVNQILHLDQSIIKLQDGTRGYIQAMIDNYSRYVLAWRVTSEYGGSFTKELIEQALRRAKQLGMSTTPDIMVDSGSENINQHVDDLIIKNKITRTIAGVEVDFSNSMVEALFHRIKNRHLYFVNLKDLETLQKETDFIINEFNNHVPHSALAGATPLQVVSGRWNEKKRANLKEDTQKARKQRIQINRNLHCGTCLA